MGSKSLSKPFGTEIKLFLRSNPIDKQNYFLFLAYFSQQLRSVLVRSEVPPRQSTNPAHKYEKDVICARIYRLSFRENMPKTLVFYD